MAVLPSMPGTSRPFHELRASGRHIEHERCPGAAKRGEKAVVYLGNVGIWPTMGVQKYTDPIARVKTNRGKPGARKAPLIAGRKPCPQCYRTVWVCTVFCPPFCSCNQGILLELHCWTLHSGRPQRQQLKDCTPWPCWPGSRVRLVTRG